MNVENIINFNISLLIKIFNKFKPYFIFIFALLLAYVYYRSFNSALETSQDMQWYPSTLFWNGLNPYSEYLNNKENWFLASAPNYGHLLYIILAPLTFFEWETVKIIWAIISVISFILIILIFYKANISTPFLLLITSLLIIGYPLSNTIGNGQISILIGLFVSIAWFYRKKSFFITMFALSIVFVKYSFGLPILFGFFLAGYYKEVSGAIFINLITVLIYSYLFDIGFIEAFILPFKVAMTATGIGPIDLMSLERLLIMKNIIELKISYLLVPIIYGVFSLIVLKYKKDILDSEIISLSIFLSLVTFFHLGYDHVMFLIAILILKSVLKANDNYLILFSLVSVLLWQCGRLSSLFNLELECAMNMGIFYTSTISLFFIVLVFNYLLNKKNDPSPL